MNPADAVPFALLLLFGVAVGIGATVFLLAVRWNRQSPKRFGRLHRASEPDPQKDVPFQHSTKRPILWLALRNTDALDIQAALALDNPKPCSWSEAMNSETRLFIAPPVRGWVLVTGLGIPDPADDVDCCFRFLRELSRKLGHVQFFQADRVLQYHAWARVDAGRVVRAYAWAEGALWNQGAKSADEMELDLKCFNYGDDLPAAKWGISELLATNVEKVPILAARWSLDPAELNERTMAPVRGIAGRTSARY